MGNQPSSSRGSTPPPELPQPPRVPPRARSPPPREALALMRGQSLNVMSQPAMAVSLPSPARPAPKLEVADQREGLPEEDVGEAMPGELEGTPEEQSSLRTDWAAARAAMEHAIGSVRTHVEGIARETMERHQEQRALEEVARLQHERKMTIYEDAETGPLDALQFPPGLEREASDSEVASLFHSSEPTTETLVEEPDQEMEASTVGHPEKVTEKLAMHEFSEVGPFSRGMPVTVKELAIVPEEQVASPEQSQVSFIEESEEEGAEADQAQASEESAPVPQDAPVVADEHPLDQAPLVPSKPLATVHEESSDTHSEHLSSSFEFPRPDTPHPVLDDPRVVSPIPFPLTSEHEDQGYGTQDDDERTTQASQRAPGKRVHWGGVEAQVAYVRPQDEEDNAEEHSPPFSRLLLPAPPPLPAPVPVPVQAVSQRDVRPERATRIAAVPRRAMPLALQKQMHKFEQGVYTVSDVRWGMALDLSSADNRSPIAFGSHGWENQQWEFQSCGAGVVIKSVSSGSFLVLEDLQGLHQEASVEVVTGDFPTCWEMEVMDNGRAEDGEDENPDVYARIRLPRSEMVLGFKGGYAGAPLFLTKDANNMSTYWRLRAPRREQVVKNPPISTTETVRHGGVTSLVTTTIVTVTTTRTVTRIDTSDA